jgi:hypothetical protein
VRHKEWDSITLPRLIGFLIGVGALFALILCSQPGFVFLLDHANLLFHEAGHPIVGLFSQRLEPYGGTLGQLAFPCVLMVHFWRRNQALSFAGSALWFFENWLNIARYLADARAMVLPLVGGGDHDWHTILGRWGLLPYDDRIATVLQLNAWLGITSVCVWVGWRFWQNRHQRSTRMSEAPLPMDLAGDRPARSN